MFIWSKENWIAIFIVLFVVLVITMSINSFIEKYNNEPVRTILFLNDLGVPMSSDCVKHLLSATTSYISYVSCDNDRRIYSGNYFLLEKPIENNNNNGESNG